MNKGMQASPPRWRFLGLTASICIWLLASSQLRERWVMQVLLELFLINFVVVTLWANPNWGRMRRVLIGLLVLALIGAASTHLPLTPFQYAVARTAESASMIPLLGLLAAGILKFVFERRQLDSDGIFATVAVYLLIAMIFAQVYVLLLIWNPSSIDLPVPIASRSIQQLHADMIYFSMVTLATVGYGDFLPVTEAARAIAMIEATVGQFYVAVVVAVFVGMYAAQRRQP